MKTLIDRRGAVNDLAWKLSWYRTFSMHPTQAKYYEVMFNERVQMIVRTRTHTQRL